MWHLIEQLNSDHIFVLTIIGVSVTFLTLVSLVPALAYQWCQVRGREAATEVVHSMLHEGKSVEEIERVLRAGGFGQRWRELASMKFACQNQSGRHGDAHSPRRAEHA